MGERTSYPPGTFSWAELVTSDPDSVAALFADDSQAVHWNCYVTVASVDETAQRATDSGGTVMHEPFDVMDVGRMAVIADPTGATLCLWEPRAHIGAALVNSPGSMTWNDVVTPDPEAAGDFYGKLFGWTFEEMPESGGYRVIRNGERSNGHGRGRRPGSPISATTTPSAWPAT